jgi:hypothetical protein
MYRFLENILGQLSVTVGNPTFQSINEYRCSSSLGSRQQDQSEHGQHGLLPEGLGSGLRGTLLPEPLDRLSHVILVLPATVYLVDDVCVGLVTLSDR